jgi:hypothetical protein
LPASDAAPELARSAVDLAVGHGRQAAHSNEVKALALELLAETARKAGARVIEFKIRSEARSVRLEARWTESPSESGATEPNRSQPSAMIRRLADQCGITHCLWAELSIA